MSWDVLGRCRTRSWWAAGSSAFGGRDGVAASRTPRWLHERLARRLNTDERIACKAWRHLEPTSLTLRRGTFVAHAIDVPVVVRLAHVVLELRVEPRLGSEFALALGSEFELGSKFEA
jgi:hypothetical protein